MSNGPQKVTDPIFVNPPPEGLLNNATQKRSQSVSWNSPREYGWDPPRPIIQGIWGFQSISRILSPSVQLGKLVMEFPAVLRAFLKIGPYQLAPYNRSRRTQCVAVRPLRRAPKFGSRRLQTLRLEAAQENLRCNLGKKKVYITTAETLLFFFFGVWGSMVYTLLSGPTVYTFFPCFPRKMVYTIAFLALWPRGRATDREKRGATVVVYTLFCLAIFYGFFKKRADLEAAKRTK